MTFLSLDLEHQEQTSGVAPPPCHMRTQLPKVWIGYLFALAFLLVVIVETTLDPSSADRVTPASFLASLAGFIYWLFCVRRLHQVVAEATDGRHPVPPSRIVVGHILPFYNIYFLFRWPNAIADFVNARSGRRGIVKGWLGLILLVGFVVGRLIDGAIGQAIIFSVVLYLARRIGSAVMVRQSPTAPAT